MVCISLHMQICTYDLFFIEGPMKETVNFLCISLCFLLIRYFRHKDPHINNRTQTNTRTKTKLINYLNIVFQDINTNT